MSETFSESASGIASTNFSISVADIFEKVDSDVVKFILPTSSQSFATAQPHAMLNFTTSESTFSNMSATEI
jgi:hypothetical protein